MLIEIPDILSANEVAGIQARLEQADWRDGAGTAGHVAARAKSNLQLADDDALGAEIGAAIVDRLAQTPRFIAAALPLR